MCVYTYISKIRFSTLEYSHLATNVAGTIITSHVHLYFSYYSNLSCIYVPLSPGAAASYGRLGPRQLPQTRMKVDGLCPLFSLVASCYRSCDSMMSLGATLGAAIILADSQTVGKTISVGEGYIFVIQVQHSPYFFIFCIFFCMSTKP